MFLDRLDKLDAEAAKAGDDVAAEALEVVREYYLQGEEATPCESPAPPPAIEEGGDTDPALCCTNCGKAPPVPGEDNCLLCLDAMDVQMQMDRGRE